MLAEPPSNRTLERPNRVEKTPDNDTIGPSKKKGLGLVSILSGMGSAGPNPFKPQAASCLLP